MNLEKIKKIPHIFAAVIIMLHSLERFETGHGSYLIFLFCGVIFLAVVLFHHRIAKRFPAVDVVFYIIESVLSFIIAYEFFTAGKKGLPAAYCFAGLLQLSAVFILFRKRRKT